MNSRRKVPLGKPQFIVQSKPNTIVYNPILDKNLDYFFSNKNNQRILRKNRVINHRNQVLDKSVTKAVESGVAYLNKTFKIRARKKNVNAMRNKTVQTSSSAINHHIKMSQQLKQSQGEKNSERPQTVDKQEFINYLKRQKQKVEQKIKLQIESQRQEPVINKPYEHKTIQ